MVGQRSDSGDGKQPARVVAKPQVKTNVVRDLEEKRASRRAADLKRDIGRTIDHLDQVTKLSHEAFDRKNAYLDAAKTGSDPKINDLAKKKAAVARVPKNKPKMDCSGGVCRIIRKKKK